MRACTQCHVRVYCTRKAIVYTFTKLHDRCIPNVGVGVRVGPVEFQLYHTERPLLFTTCSP